MLRRGPARDELWSNIAPEVKVHIEEAPTDRAEAEFVVHKIEQHLGGATFFSLDSERVDERGLPQDFTFSDFAILLRSRRLAPPIIEALARSGIPFQNIDDEALMTLPFVRFILAAMRGWNGGDRESVGAAALEYLPKERVDDFLREYHMAPDDDDIVSMLSRLGRFAREEERDDAAQIIKKLQNLALTLGERKDRFLDALLLQRQIDRFDDRAERINVLTLHAAKGLEFPIVFIIGCEEGVIPHVLPGQKPDVEEERRLLYVGMTRAQRRLYLSYAKRRMIFGKQQAQQPSHFLKGISESLLQREQRQVKRKRQDNQLKLF